MKIKERANEQTFEQSNQKDDEIIERNTKIILKNMARKNLLRKFNSN